MADTLTITLAQLNQTVGDVAGNAAAMLAARGRAAGADLVVFPELHLIGYPPEDLILKPALIERAAAELDRLALATAGEGPAMLVGSAFVRDGQLHNGVALLRAGSRRCGSSANCPITAPLMKCACSSPARCLNPSCFAAR